MKISECLNIFLDNCYIKGLSERTMGNYKDRVSYFIRFVGDIDIKSVNEDSLKSYSRYLLNKKANRSRQTVRTYLNELKVFLTWCFTQNYICDHIYKFVILPKKHNKIVPIYSDTEIQSIFNSFEYQGSWLQYRNYAIISLMYDSGLRCNEVCKLQLQDINFDKNLILVNGKGGKQRFVPLGSATKKYILAYLKVSPVVVSDNIFISQYREPLTTNAINNIFYRIQLKTGINVSAHKLRHNFATNYLIMQYESKGQADIYQLMMILGHSDVETTMIYLHMAQQILLTKQPLSKLDTITKKIPSVDSKL